MMKRILIGSFIAITLLATGLFGQNAYAAKEEKHPLRCASGVQPKQTAFGTAIVVTCEDGNIIQDGTSGDPFTIDVNCPNSDFIFETGHDPAHQQVFICSATNQPKSDGNVPAVQFSSGDAGTHTLNPGGTFQGDDRCNGGVSVGVGLSANDTGKCVGSKDDNPIYAYLRGIIQFASGIFGILVVLMIVVSGIQYITSAGNPTAVAAAKKRLGNAVLGIILFLLMFAILNYLIPGGIITGGGATTASATPAPDCSAGQPTGGHC